MKKTVKKQALSKKSVGTPTAKQDVARALKATKKVMLSSKPAIKKAYPKKADKKVVDKGGY